MKINVKRINPVGFCDYPALQNTKTGQIYVDVCLADSKALECDETGHNRHGEFVNYNIKGAWHIFCEEPEMPLRKDLEFVLEN